MRFVGPTILVCTLGCGSPPPARQPKRYTAADVTAALRKPCPDSDEGGPSRECIARCIERSLAGAGVPASRPFARAALRGGGSSSNMSADFGAVSATLATWQMEQVGAMGDTACPNTSLTFRDPRYADMDFKLAFVISVESHDPTEADRKRRICDHFKQLDLRSCAAE